MPQDDPQIGETWELISGAERGETTVTSSAPGARAVILGFQGEAVRLESHTGRVIAVPRRTFIFGWRFVGTPESRACSIGNCSLPARFLQNWDGMETWVCFEHVNLQNEAQRVCPACEGLGQRIPSEPTGLGVPEINECQTCRRYWSFLTGRGDDTDGFEFTAWIQQIADHLEGSGRFVCRVRLGRVALATLRRAVGNLGNDPNDPQFLGTHMIADDSVGSNNLVAIGYHVTEIRGVSQISSANATLRDPAPNPLPATGSEWRAVLQPYDTVTVFGLVQEGSDTTVRFGTETSIDRLPLREFFAKYRLPLTEETVGVVKAIDAQNPRRDETWWANDFTGPLYVIGVYTTNDVEYVKFRTRAGQTRVVTKQEFLKVSLAVPPIVACSPGDEWEDPSDKEVFTIVNTDNQFITLRRNSTGEERRELSWAIARWKKIVRKSIFERIMEDED